MSGSQATQIHNERTKLTATILNNVAAAFIVAGFVGPLVNGAFAGGYPLAWIIVGAGLHYLARVTLGGLK
jgi:hypothetical protein